MRKSTMRLLFCVIVVGLIGLFIFALWSFTGVIIKTQDRVEQLVSKDDEEENDISLEEEGTEENLEDYEEDIDRPPMQFKDELVSDEDYMQDFRYASKIYVDSDEVELQKALLGEDRYELYAPVFESINKDCMLIMSLIKDNEVDDYNIRFTKMYDYRNEFRIEGLESSGPIYIDNMLTVLGFCNDTCVIGEFGYPNGYNELVVFDFEKVFFKNDEVEAYQIGDVISVAGVLDLSTVRQYGDFKVLYMKG